MKAVRSPVNAWTATGTWSVVITFASALTTSNRHSTLEAISFAPVSFDACTATDVSGVIDSTTANHFPHVPLIVGWLRDCNESGFTAIAALYNILE